MLVVNLGVHQVLDVFIDLVQCHDEGCHDNESRDAGQYLKNGPTISAKLTEFACSSNRQYRLDYWFNDLNRDRFWYELFRSLRLSLTFCYYTCSSGGTLSCCFSLFSRHIIKNRTFDIDLVLKRLRISFPSILLIEAL